MNRAPPTRCCAPATSGRCSNAPAPHGQSRYIGCVEIAACNQPKHQAALRSLPDFTRRDGVCGTDDCGKPTQLGICPEHRQLYQRHGVSIRALLATEPAPMTESTADVPDAVAPAPPTAPGPTVAELETQLAAERARADLLDDAAMLQRERADAAQAELAAIAALLDADPERSPAWDANDKPIPLVRRVEVALMPDGVGKSELERRYDGLAEKAELLRRIIDETEWIVHHCGSYGATASLADRLFRLLAPEQQRAILELQRAEAAADVARLKARFLNPPPPEKLSEYQRKLDIVEAKLCSLDHSPDAGKMVD